MSEKFLTKTFFIIIAWLLLVNVLASVGLIPSWHIRRLINVGFEGNIPTWFSSILLAIAAYWAYKCSLVSNINIKERHKTVWKVLALLLILMSCDEIAQMHEHLGRVINKYFFNSIELASTWIVYLGIPIVLMLVIVAIQVYSALEKPNIAGKFLVIGFILYITGAFLLEATINLFNHETLEWLWRIENITEEIFEMTGVFLIVKGLYKYYKFSNRLNVNKIKTAEVI